MDIEELGKMNKQLLEFIKKEIEFLKDLEEYLKTEEFSLSIINKRIRQLERTRI